MVGGGEALIVETSCTAGSDDNGLCLCYEVILGLKVLKNCACNLTLFVLDELNCCGELNNGNLTVQNLVANGSHDLRARVVLTSVHSLSGGSAAVGGDHIALCVLIEHNAEVVEPTDSVGSFHNETSEKLGTSGKVSAAESVEIVLNGRVVGLICSLDTALSHHSVSITNTELCNDHYVSARLVSLDRCRAACAAAADYENVNVIIYLIKVDLLAEDTAIGVKELTKLARNLFALVGTNLDLNEAILAIVGVVSLKKSGFFISGHTSGLCSHTCFARCFKFLYGFKHFLSIHSLFPPYFSISLVL